MLLPLLMNLDFAAGNVIPPPDVYVPSQSTDGVHGGGGTYYKDQQKKENDDILKKQIKDEDDLFEMILQGFLKMMN